MSDEETQQPEDGLTLEQLNEIDTDPEGEKKAGQSIQLPAGWYNSVPELTLKVGKAEKSGRAYARFFGQFRPASGNTLGREGKAGFAVSWEMHYKDDGSGKADLMSRLWVSAGKTYRLVHQLPDDAPVKVGAVLAFLQKYSVAIRFILGDDDNMAVQISPVKE